mgnify:CR=1 FL=1
MSTILPLETVFGRSTWVRQTTVPSNVRGYDPSPLFGIQFAELSSLGISPRSSYTDQQKYPDPFNPSPFERIPHSEGPLGDGWDDHDAFLKSSGRPIYADSQETYRFGLYTIDVWSPDGRFGIDKWGPELVAGYRFIKPFIFNEDGTFSRPFEFSDIAAPYQDEFFIGECGSGGSERPEAGLLYPRKV